MSEVGGGGTGRDLDASMKVSFARSVRTCKAHNKLLKFIFLSYSPGRLLFLVYCSELQTLLKHFGLKLRYSNNNSGQ